MAKTAAQTPERRKSAPRRKLTTSASENTFVSEDTIARRAFEFYCARGGEHGRDVDDWLQAERELRTSGGQDAAGENAS